MLKQPTPDQIASIDTRVEELVRQFSSPQPDMPYWLYAQGLVYPEYGTTSDEVNIRFTNTDDWLVTVTQFDPVITPYRATFTDFAGRSLDQGERDPTRRGYLRLGGNLLKVASMRSDFSTTRPRRAFRSDAEKLSVELAGFRGRE